MIRQFFDRQMARLLGLRFAPVELTTHWEALRDMPDDILEASVSRAQKTRVDFPTPSELRQDADQVAHLVRAVDDDDEDSRKVPLEDPLKIVYSQAAAVIPVRETWRYDCEDCSDTGWQTVWCGPFTVNRKPWNEPRTCDRRGAHGSHEWARICSCSDTNRTLIRRRLAQTKYAEKPGKAA